MRAAILIPAVLFQFQPTQEAESAPPASHVDVLAGQAEALAYFVESEVGARFLAAVPDLPPVEPRRVLWNRATGAALSAGEAEEREGASLEGFEENVFDTRRYYETFYGTPVAYARAIDLAGRHGFEADGGRVLDFGYGGIGHLRVLASLGADVVGVEVMELLRALYSEPSDTGEIARSAAAGEGGDGRIALVHGRFPAEPDVVRAVGGGYSLVVSKNVLKKGYVHPERETDPSRLVHLGVDDEAFLRAVHDALRPGGLFVVYNLYGQQAPDDEPYRPWATGGFPFERALAESIGFEVRAFDVDDTRAAREMGRALGWEATMDLENDLFGAFTILRRAE